MIVIGDVHGEFDHLMRLMEILPQTKDICFVGDLIDRGSKSKEVIEFIRKNNYHSVLGNHEDMAVDDSLVNLWISNGGWKTIQSYGGIDEFRGHSDYRWLKDLPLIIEYKNYIISHSFYWNDHRTGPNDILWGRSFLEDNCEGINIFGHTPMDEVIKINNKHYCIDTGCTFGNRLSAIDLDDEKIYYVETSDE